MHQCNDLIIICYSLFFPDGTESERARPKSSFKTKGSYINSSYRIRYGNDDSPRDRAHSYHGNKPEIKLNDSYYRDRANTYHGSRGDNSNIDRQPGYHGNSYHGDRRGSNHSNQDKNILPRLSLSGATLQQSSDVLIRQGWSVTELPDNGLREAGE